MPVYVAFLRAINVTGRFIKMADLAAAFHDLGHRDARTYINSGNVIFGSPLRSAAKLEAALQAGLAPRLGFVAEAFVRTAPQLQALAARAQGLRGRVAEGGDVNVCFLQAPLDAGQTAQVQALKSGIDDFDFGEREVFWLCLARQSDSRFSNAVLERRLRVRSTLRRASMLQALAGEL